MSTLNDIVTQVLTLAQAAGITGTLGIGATPPDGGTVLTPAAGYPTSTMGNKGMVYHSAFVCNSKNADQQIAFENLSLIHTALTKTVSYPEGTGFQIINIDTTSAPQLIGRCIVTGKQIGRAHV